MQARAHRTDRRISHRAAFAFIAALVLAVLAVATPAAADDDLWIHVRVEENDGATVRLNLPIAFVETAARSIPASFEADSLSLDDENITVAELRDMWASLGDTGETLLVDVDDDGESVKVRKTGGFLLIEVDELDPYDGEHRADVDVRIPERVVDALLAGSGNQLDVAAALRALADAGEGELVAVADRDARVRIWVDGIADAD